VRNPTAEARRAALGRVLSTIVLASVALAACATVPRASDTTSPGLLGIEAAHLDPEHWIERRPRAERMLLDPKQIAARNAKLFELDPSVNDLARFPAQLTRTQVEQWIRARSARPDRPMFDTAGTAIGAEQLAQLFDALALDAIPPVQRTRYGLVVRRADLRTFPTRLRVLPAAEERDIDLFQESAAFPGTPVVIAHTSRDGDWLFVVTPHYRAWIERQHVAEGRADEVLGYARRAPYLIVTGSQVRTAFTPERPEVSELTLDMGVRLPLVTSWPAHEPVNGQHPHAAYIVELPLRDEQGRLELAPALLPRAADVALGYLPFTEANLIRQSFKFLGERYGWGHAYHGRDCSGFVAEVYRSFGIELPRNTRDQALSPVFTRIELRPDMSRADRIALLRSLEVGDLIYIPGHVMMVIGRERGEPYVIHDTAGITYRDSERLVRVPLNSVVVTPLVPLLIDEQRTFVDEIYSIQRLR